MAVFQAAELLIPREELLENWAVIACDQFTSQPEYWQAVRAQVGEKPSAYHLVFPEAELGKDEAERIAAINAHMREYLAGDVFRTYPDACVYVERTLLDGSVRRGVVGVIDLECYDYRSLSETPVRATEQTVTSRIPPRVRIRGGAPLEASHALLLMDDKRGNVLDTLETRREELPLLYDFDLMQGGGHIEGRLVTGAAAAALRPRCRAMRRRPRRAFQAPERPRSSTPWGTGTTLSPRRRPAGRHSRSRTPRLPERSTPRATPWWSCRTFGMRPSALSPSTAC